MLFILQYIDTMIYSYAILNYATVSQQKMNLIAKLVRGKSVKKSLDILTYTPNKSAWLLVKLIASAYNNYTNNVAWDLTDSDLLISIDVGKGITLKRARFTSRARVYTYYKHRSFVKVSLYA